MYVISQAFKAVRHNPIASLSTFTTMVLSLMVLAAFSLFSLNLNLMLREMQSELEMAAFLSRNADFSAIHTEIQQWPEIAESRYVSPDDALAELTDRYEYVDKAASLVANPLPPTIEMRLKDPSQTTIVTERLRQIPFVEDVEDGSEAVESFLAIRNAFRFVGSVLIIVLLAAALFAMVNTIRVAITARKDEIEVMRLVGATKNFIRAPFLLEGLGLGLTSGLLSTILVASSYSLIVNRLADRIPIIPLLKDFGTVASVCLLIFLLALLVGLVGSAISVSQYLEEA